MSGYIRADTSTYKGKIWYLIPTISISSFKAGIEISLLILCFVIYTSFRYIKEDEYEP